MDSTDDIICEYAARAAGKTSAAIDSVISSHLPWWGRKARHSKMPHWMKIAVLKVCAWWIRLEIVYAPGVCIEIRVRGKKVGKIITNSYQLED
jgi:hypothetical protein